MPSVEDNNKALPESVEPMPEGLLDQGRSSVFTHNPIEYDDPLPADSTPVTGQIDVSRFVKAMAAYHRAQTHFLQHRGRPGTEEYQHNLTQFSWAQAAFIAAQDEVLHQLDVV